MALSEREIILKFNNLDGKEVTRIELQSIYADAIKLSKRSGSSDVIKTIAAKLTSAVKKLNGHQSAILSVTKVSLPTPGKRPSKKPAPRKDESIDQALHGLELIQDESQLESPFDQSLSGTKSTYQIVTEKIIEAIKNEGLVWRVPWNITGTDLPAMNFKTKKPYTGFNYLYLNLIVRRSNPYWLTWKQVKELKGYVKKGANGEIAVYYNFMYRQEYDYNSQGKTIKLNKPITLKEDDLTAIVRRYQKQFGYARNRIRQQLFDIIPFLKYYYIFNGEDIEGIDWNLPKPTERTDAEKIQSAESIVEQMPNPPTIESHAEGSAFYLRSDDLIKVPRIGFFDQEQKYYSTLFHEMIHSTGHEKRVHREKEMGRTFGDKNYAFEELIAEIGAAYLCADAGILYHTLDNSAAYIKGWKSALIKHMGKDEKFILKAAAQSQKAVDYILAQGDYANLKSTKKGSGKTSPNRKPVRPAKKKENQLKIFAPTLAGFTRADQAPEEVANTFELPGEMGKFLGTLQRHKLVINVTGDYHGGKSEFVKQLIDAFADINFTVGLFDLEQGGMASKDTVDSLKRNVKPGNMPKIAVTGEAEKGLETVKEFADQFDVIVVDSGQKLGLTTNDWLDQLRSEFPQTIFVIIFQQNAEGNVRGGAAADFDAPVALKAHRVNWNTYKDNYVSIKKNRGNRTDLRYMIADKKTVEEADTLKNSEE